MIRFAIVGSIKSRQTFFAVDAGRVLRAVNTNSTARHLAPDVETEISLVNVWRVATFIGMAVTLTFLAAILLLRCSDSERFLIVQWTTFLAVLPACVVHAFT